MRGLDWWLGILLVIAALLAHALLPRFDWRTQPGMTGSVRLDRWTGAALWVDERRARILHLSPDLQLTQQPLRAPILDVLDDVQREAEPGAVQ